MPTTTFTIKGMHSQICTRPLETALRQVVGVKQVFVNYGTEQAVVEHDGRSHFQDFSTIVQQIGYRALHQDSLDYQHDLRLLETNHIRRLRLHFILALILTPLILIGSFPTFFSFIPAFFTSSYLLLLLALPIQFYAGSDLYRGFWYALRLRTVDSDSLLALGTSAAFLASFLATFFPWLFASALWSLFTFATPAVLITCIMGGRYLEAVARRHTSDSLRTLFKLQPAVAMVIRHGRSLEVPLSEVVVGDILLVTSGQHIPVDGIITEGTSLVDASMLGGQQTLLEKSKGMKVLGGTINKQGSFQMKAVAVGKDTLLAHIIAGIRAAQSYSTPLQTRTDNIVRYFAPFLLMLSLVSFVVWILFGPSPALAYGFLSFISILLVASPHALTLAAPTALMVGTGKAAQQGILLTEADTLEAMTSVDTVVFDKTGILTKGKPVVSEVIAFQGDEKTVLKFAALAELHINHPLAHAILAYAQHHQLPIPEAHASVLHPGKGVVAKYLGKKVAVGNRQLMQEQGIVINHLEQRLQAMESSGKTVLLIGINAEVVGVLGITDASREYADAAVQALQRLGKQVCILTGDSEPTAQALAQDLDIAKVFAPVLPQDKAGIIQTLQAQGHRVAFIGSGESDAASLAQADVGIAFGLDTPIPLEKGNVLLLKHDLRDVVTAFDLSRSTVQTMKRSLWGVSVYHVLGIALAVGVVYPFTGFLLNPMIAGGAMALSSLVVVLNSLLLKKYRTRL